MEHISTCLRTLMQEGMKARGETPCVICGIRKIDDVDSFPVCSVCRPDFERDYDIEVDAQIKTYEEMEDLQ